MTTHHDSFSMPGSRVREGHAATVLSIVGQSRMIPVTSSGTGFRMRGPFGWRLVAQALTAEAVRDANELSLRTAREAAANPRVSINIAQCPDDVGQRTYMALIGGACHEAWHRLYSQQGPLKGSIIAQVIRPVLDNPGVDWKRRTRLVLDLQNVVEDIMIERIGNAEFPGTRVKMCDLADYIVRMETASRVKAGNPPAKLVQTVFVAWRDMGLGYNTMTVRDNLIALKAQCPEGFAMLAPGGVLNGLFNRSIPAVSTKAELTAAKQALLDGISLYIALQAVVYLEAVSKGNPSPEPKAPKAPKAQPKSGKGDPKPGKDKAPKAPKPQDDDADDDGDSSGSGDPEDEGDESEGGSGSGEPEDESGEDESEGGGSGADDSEDEGDESEGNGSRSDEGDEGDEPSKGSGKGKGSDKGDEPSDEPGEGESDEPGHSTNDKSEDEGDGDGAGGGEGTNPKTAGDFLNQANQGAGTLDSNSALEQGVKAELKADKVENPTEMPYKPFCTSDDEVVRVKPDSANAGSFKTIRQETRKVTTYLKTRLATAFRALECSGVEHGVRKGLRVSDRTLVDTFCELKGNLTPSRAYLDRQPEIDMSVAAVLVVDESYSMVNKLRETCAVAYALMDALDTIGAKSMAFGFRAKACSVRPASHAEAVGCHRTEAIRYDLFKSWDERFQTAAPKLREIKATGGTPMADGLEFALTELSHRPEGYRIVFVLTDGQPDSEHAMVLPSQLRRAAEAGVLVVGVGLGKGSEYVKTTFPDSVYEANIDALPKVLVAKVETLVRTRHTLAKRGRAVRAA